MPQKGGGAPGPLASCDGRGPMPEALCHPPAACDSACPRTIAFHDARSIGARLIDQRRSTSHATLSRATWLALALVIRGSTI